MLALLAQVLGDVMQTPMGRLLVGLLVLAVVILVGRIVLRIAWKLVILAAVVVGVLYVLSVVSL